MQNSLGAPLTPTSLTINHVPCWTMRLFKIKSTFLIRSKAAFNLPVSSAAFVGYIKLKACFSYSSSVMPPTMAVNHWVNG